MAANLPEVVAFKKKLENNPEIAKQYLLSLKAFQTLKQKDFKVTLGNNESKIIEFDDGSFIQVSSSNKLNTTAQPLSSLSLRPLGISRHSTDDFNYQIWGLYMAANLHLYTTYDWDYLWANITDQSVTASVYFPAWLVSKSATRVSDTRAKGDFAMQDELGSFSAVLITDITPGVSYPTVSHTKL